VATFLHKPDATVYPVSLTYVGFEIPDRFVVGYGLDYDGLGRNHHQVYQLATGDADES
jgi:hypoxanthine phosphoribosyltransferase